MRRLLSTLATVVLGVGLSSGVAAASTVTCGITNTGPGSNNTVTCVDSNNVQVTCTNNVVVANSSSQSSSSGSASTSGNTSGGSSSSGNASNSNTVTVNLGASCAPVASGTAAAAGGKGGTLAFTTLAAASPGTSAASGVAALPETGSNTALDTALIGVAVLGGSMVASRLSLMAYRRHTLK